MYDFLNADKYGHFVTFRKYFRRWVEKRKKKTNHHLPPSDYYLKRKRNGLFCGPENK